MPSEHKRAPRSKQGQNALRSEHGQAMIEFVLTMLLLFSLIFFFIQLSLILSFGNFVQYATFMSARAYLSGGVDPADQEARAVRVMATTVKGGANAGAQDRFPMFAQGFGSGQLAGVQVGPGQGFDETDYDLSWMQGVRYTFRSRLFLLPLGKTTAGGANGLKGDGQLELTSESWLGREPTYKECATLMQGQSWKFDNGC